MADAVQSGRALRMYHIIMILALGWGAGRLPDVIERSRATGQQVQQELTAEAQASEAQAVVRKTAGPVDQEEFASQIAARVAQETIFRLIDAGWGPRDANPQLMATSAAHRPPAQEVVVRLEQADRGRAPIIFDLPPGNEEYGQGHRAAAVRPAERDVEEAGSQEEVGPVPSQVSAAYRLANRGYDALRRGDRRLGTKYLTEAVALDPADPQAAVWMADVRRLTKRWSIAGYTVARKESTGLATAASPVLGGGQTAVAVGYTLDPLAKRPLSVMGRLAAASGTRQGIDSSTAEAALGVRYQLFEGLAVDVERRFALGTFGRNAWSARVSGGLNRSLDVAGRPVTLDAYAEGGAIGITAPDFYGGAQLRGATPVATIGKVAIDGGAGMWGAAQQGYGQTISRFDIGPSARFRLEPWPVSAQIDYRIKAAGNANPGSGPVFTVSGEF